MQGMESSIWHPRSLSTALTSSLCPSHLPPELQQLEVGGWLSQGWLLLGCQRPPGCGKTPLVGFVASRSPERSHQLRIARVTSPVSWRGARQLPQITAMEQCKQEQGLVTRSVSSPFVFTDVQFTEMRLLAHQSICHLRDKPAFHKCIQVTRPVGYGLQGISLSLIFGSIIISLTSLLVISNTSMGKEKINT